jgi:hypothetical protein
VPVRIEGAAKITVFSVAAAILLTRSTIFPPRLIDRCEIKSSAKETAPVVVVGVLSADVLIKNKIPMHADPQIPLQLRRLTIRVENVLKGAPIPNKISVYYFTWAGGFDGPAPLG